MDERVEIDFDKQTVSITEIPSESDESVGCHGGQTADKAQPQSLGVATSATWMCRKRVLMFVVSMLLFVAAAFCTLMAHWMAATALLWALLVTYEHAMHLHGQVQKIQHDDHGGRSS